MPRTFSPVSIADVGDFLRFRFSSHVEFRHVLIFQKPKFVDRLTAPYRNTRSRLILFSKEDKLRTLLKFKRFQGNSEFDLAFPNCQEMSNCLRFSSSNLVLPGLDCQVSGAVKSYINSISTEREINC